MGRRRFSRDERVDAKVRELVSKGWKAETGGEHPKLISPQGRRICYSTTPSDPRGTLNWLTRVRRIECSGLPE